MNDQKEAPSEPVWPWPAQSIGQDDSKNTTQFVATFDGHGGLNVGDNLNFSLYVTSIGEGVHRFSSGVGNSPVRSAIINALRFIKGNSSGVILAVGYSSGGVDAIKFTRALAAQGVLVESLVTFDPRSSVRPPFLGAHSYVIPDGVKAVNFYQRGPYRWRTNPFFGARLIGAQVTNHNLTGIVDHTHIVGYVWESHWKWMFC